MNKFEKMLAKLTPSAEVVYVISDDPSFRGVGRVYVRPEGKRRFWRLTETAAIQVNYDPVRILRNQVRSGRYVMATGQVGKVPGNGLERAAGPIEKFRGRAVSLLARGSDGQAGTGTDPAVLSSFRQDIGRRVLMNEGPVSVLPTGFDALSKELGIGGYPKGRIVELFGTKSSFVALNGIAAIQKAGGLVAYIDASYSLDIQRAQELGVQTDRILVSQPGSPKAGMEVAEVLIRSGAVEAVYIDSFEDLVPNEGAAGNERDRIMSNFVKQIATLARNTGTTVFVLNRPSLGQAALRFYTAVRISVDSAPEDRTVVRVIKNLWGTTWASFEIQL